MSDSRPDPSIGDAEKPSDDGSNKGCMTVGGILGVLVLAGAILMAVFWVKSDKENAELRKKVSELQQKVEETTCYGEDYLKEKETFQAA